MALSLEANFGLIPNISEFDKVVHFILVGILAWLFNSAFRLGQLNLGGLTIFVGTVVVVTVITFEEFAQLWMPIRHFEPLDLLAGYLGIATAEMFLRRRALLADRALLAELRV